MGNQSSKIPQNEDETTFLIPAATQQLTNAEHKPHSIVQINERGGIKPFSEATPDTQLNTVPAYGEMSHDSSRKRTPFSPGRPRGGLRLPPQYPESTITTSIPAAHHSALKPPPPIKKAPITHSEPRSTSTSSKSENDGATHTPHTREAHAAITRIMDRHLAEEQNMGISYHGPPTPSSLTSISFDTLPNIEAARAQEHQPLHLRHPSPSPPQSSLSDPFSDEDDYEDENGPIVFSSRSRRRWDLGSGLRNRRPQPWDLGPGYRDHWWNFNFDEWNACIGVWLLFAFVVCVAGAAGAAIWIFVRQ